MTLNQLAIGVYAWLDPDPAPGRPNAGVVVDADGLTVVDTLMLPAQAQQLAAALEPLGLPVRRAVLTTSHLEYTGGTSVFRMAAVYGTSQVSTRLEQPPNASGYQHRFPEAAAAFAELQTRPVSHVVGEAAYLTPALVAVPISGQIAENLVVQVPAAGVVFAGAMCSFGVTPLAFDGDPAGWADALDTVAELGSIIVPGHGPVGGTDQLREQQAYLRACVQASGDVARLSSGPWDTWPGREYDAINVERAARLAAGDDQPPESMLRLLGMA